MGAVSKGSQTLRLRKPSEKDGLPRTRRDTKPTATGDGFVSFGSYAVPTRKFRISWKNTKILSKVVKRALTYKNPNFKRDPWYFDIRTVCICLILGNVGYQFANYFNGLVASDYYTAFQYRDKKLFGKVLMKSILYPLLTSFLTSLNNFFAGIIQAKSRKSLTFYTNRNYIQKGILHMVPQEKRIDNPDQRITQDIDKLTASFLDIMSVILIQPAVIIYYTVRTWLITGYYGPVCLYAYFIIGSIIVAVLFPMAASKVFMQEKAEGYFRNQHIKIRDDSEEIALMKSEKNLKSETNKYMGILYTLQRRVVQYTFPVFMFQQFYVYAGAPMSDVVFSFRVFSGYYKDIDPKLIPGMISRSVFISISLVYALSQVVSIASNLPSLFGYAIRISQFWDEIERLELENADREIQRSTDGS
ncbi:hypothetical protein BB560_006470, partial [Smittium megazygosporum]